MAIKDIEELDAALARIENAENYDTSSEDENDDISTIIEQEVDRQTTESEMSYYSVQRDPSLTTTVAQPQNTVFSGYDMHADNSSPYEELDNKSCVSIELENLVKEFGEWPSSREGCFACERGRNKDTALNYMPWVSIQAMYKEQSAQCGAIELVNQIYNKFEASIRTPMNKMAAINGLRPIPEWRHMVIWSHFFQHIREPSVILRGLVDDSYSLISNLKFNVMYKRRRSAHGHIIQVPRSKYYNMYHKERCLLMRLLSVRNVDQMFGADPSFNLNDVKITPLNMIDRPLFKPGLRLESTL